MIDRDALIDDLDLAAQTVIESPAPRPVISSGARSSKTQLTAAEVVVLPMPISPVAEELYVLRFLLADELDAGLDGL